MKKIISISIGVMIAIGSFAQTGELKPVSIGFNFGGQAGLYPLDAEEIPKIYEPSVFQLNAKGMLNETWGIMLGTQYQMIETEFKTPTNYVKLFAHGIVNLGEVMNFESFTKSLGLYAHGGIGAAAMWNPDRFENPQSRLINAADEMFALGIGLSPYFAVNENWSVNLDYSFDFHLEQSRHFDMGELLETGNKYGRAMTLTLGVSYHFSFSEDKPYLM
ncbi:MAG: outer membrane protein [Bacteroidota bacterium]